MLGAGVGMPRCCASQSPSHPCHTSGPSERVLAPSISTRAGVCPSGSQVRADCGAEDWGKGPRRGQAPVVGPALWVSDCHPRAVSGSLQPRKLQEDKGHRLALGGGIPPGDPGAAPRETVLVAVRGVLAAVSRDSHQRSHEPAFPLRVLWLNREPPRASSSKEEKWW